MSKMEYSAFIKTLANPGRLEIINSLYEKGPLNVTQICRNLKFKQSTVSHHLAKLARCSYVFQKPNGKERVYSLNKRTIQPLIKIINKHVMRYCPHCHGVNKRI